MSAPKRTTLEDVLAVAAAYMHDNHPREIPVELVIPLRSGLQIRHPWPVEPARAGPCTHSADYRDCTWHGIHYPLFTKMQAAIIQVLWEADEKGTPEVGQAALLEAAGSMGARVRDVFRGHPAWGEMLGPTGNGTFRLLPPEEAVSEAG